MNCQSAYFCENNFPIYITHIFINIINMSILHVAFICKSHPLKINISMNVSGHKFTFKRQETHII